MNHPTRSLFLLSLAIFGASQQQVANGAVFVPSRQNHGYRSNKDVISAAQAMNSVAFLSELVKLKDTSDVKFYVGGTSSNGNEHDDRNTGISSEPKAASQFLRRIRGGFSAAGMQRHLKGEEDVTIKTDTTSSRCKLATTSTEYTGNLWFMPKKGVRFQETVSISNISKDGSSAVVECVTKYRRSGRWVDCSKVICKLSSVEQGIDIVADSIVLVRLPLPGVAGKAVRSKISSSFETAAATFFGGIANGGGEDQPTAASLQYAQLDAMASFGQA